MLSLDGLVTDTENNLPGHSLPEGWPSHTGFYGKAASKHTVNKQSEQAVYLAAAQ